jgi:hypothetical protein
MCCWRLWDVWIAAKRFAEPALRRLMKAFVRIFLVAVSTMTGFGIGWWMQAYLGNQSPALVTGYDVGPVLEQIHTMSSLTTLRVEVADALVTELRGRTGGVQAVVVIHGEVMIGVDLSRAKFESVDETRRNAILLLPEPNVQSISLDHNRTKVVGLNTIGLWIMVPGEEDVDAAVANLGYQDAQRVVSVAATDPLLIQQSRRQAEFVIQSFARPIQCRIEIKWSH